MDITNLNERLQKGILTLEKQGILKIEDLNVTIYAKEGKEISIKKRGNDIFIIYDQESHFYMAMARSLGMQDGDQTVAPKVKKLGFMLDCSRNAVPKVESIKKLTGLLALIGYDYLELYTEETYELPDEPYFGYMRGRYSAKELKECAKFAQLFGMELVPCIQTLAHLGNLTNWRPYFEHTDIDDILLVGDERTYALIRKMLTFCKETFLTNRVHIGMDEAFRLGRGRYTDTYGYRPKNEIYVEHLKKVFEICEQVKLKPEFWADGFYETELPNEEIRKLFNGTQTPIYWNYYTDKKDFHVEKMLRLKECAGKVSYAGGTWKWIGYAPNNAWSDKVTDAAYEAALDCGVEDILMTAWGDNGAECSFYAILPSMWHAAEVVYPFQTDKEIILCTLTGYTDTEWRKCDKLNFMVEDTKNVSNAIKYLMHNDFLLGLMNENIPENAGKVYEKLYGEFSELAKRQGPYQYLFETYEAACRVLIRKATYSKRLYQAYQDRDKKKLYPFLEELFIIEEDLKAFYDKLRIQWMNENKGFGFEVLDVRIGGLISRIKTVIYILEEYIEGRTEKIYELEEKRVDYFCGQLQGEEAYTHLHNIWSTMYTVNHI